MRRRRARLVMAVVLLVLPLFAGELLIRGLVLLGRLPEAPAYERPFEVSWRNYHLAWPVDILIIGDSMTEHAVPPAVLDEGLASRMGHPVTSYNLASSGADFKVNRAVIDALIREHRLPPVVLIGVSPPSLTGKDTFETVFAPSPMGSRIAGCGWATTPEDWLSCQLTQVSDLWAWRGEPSRVAQAFVSAMPRTLPGPGSPLQMDGYRPGAPATQSRLDQEMAILDAGSPGDFQLGPTAEADLLAMVSAIRAAGSTAIGFTIPHSPPLLSSLVARHADWDILRRAAVARLASESGIPIIDVDAFGTWWKPQDSRDPIHLSRLGGPLFTKQLMGTAPFVTDLAAALQREGLAAR